MKRPVRVLLVNLRAPSNPAVLIPWLVALLVARRVDVVCLQECTPRHAAWLRRLPRWTLIGDAEALLVRRRHFDSTQSRVYRDMSTRWRGPIRQHPPRVTPFALVAGWLTVASIHFPPNWIHGPADRRAAGVTMLRRLQVLAGRTDDPMFLAGDWNATIKEFLARLTLAGDWSPTGRGIDYALHRGVRVRRWRRLRRGPGMDHDPVLMVVTP